MTIPPAYRWQRTKKKKNSILFALCVNLSKSKEIPISKQQKSTTFHENRITENHEYKINKINRKLICCAVSITNEELWNYCVFQFLFWCCCSSSSFSVSFIFLSAYSLVYCSFHILFHSIGFFFSFSVFRARPRLFIQLSGSVYPYIQLFKILLM